MRRRVPPTECASTTVRFTIGSEHGYLLVGEYPDGTPCRVQVVIAKEGGKLRGMLDSWSRLVSLSLQYGVPLEEIVAECARQKFEPDGFSDVPDLGYCSSIPDLVARWLKGRYLGREL